MKNISGTSSETILCSQGLWKGKLITVTNQIESPRLIENHALEVMHHYGDKGEHYCPTQLLMCPYCGGLADEPEPYECNKWGCK